MRASTIKHQIGLQAPGRLQHEPAALSILLKLLLEAWCDPGMAFQVWAVGLSLWLLRVGNGTVGEAWVTPTSQLQLLGFALLLLGTIIYAQVC